MSAYVERRCQVASDDGHDGHKKHPKSTFLRKAGLQFIRRMSVCKDGPVAVAVLYRGAFRSGAGSAVRDIGMSDVHSG